MLMNKDSSPNQRRSFKSAPLFNETEYRKDFYTTVLEVQPLFTEFPKDNLEDAVLSLVGTDISAADSADASLAKLIKSVLKEKLSPKLQALKNSESQNDKSIDDKVLDGYVSEFESAINAVKTFVEYLSDESNFRDFNLAFKSSPDIPGILIKIHKYIAQLYYLLDFSDIIEDLKPYYDFDTQHCFSIIMKNEPVNAQSARRLLDSLSFDKKRFDEANWEDTVKKSLRKNKELPKKFGQDIHVLLGKLKENLRDRISRLLKEEERLKCMVFTSNDINAHAGNIFEEVIARDLQSISQNFSSQAPKANDTNDIEGFKETLKNKKFEQICQFNSTKTGNYMSVQSIGDYEEFMNGYVSKLEQILAQQGEKRKVMAQILTHYAQLKPSKEKRDASQLMVLLSKKSIAQKIREIYDEYGSLEEIRILEKLFGDTSPVVVEGRIIELYSNFDPRMKNVLKQPTDEKYFYFTTENMMITTRKVWNYEIKWKESKVSNNTQQLKNLVTVEIKDTDGRIAAFTENFKILAISCFARHIDPGIEDQLKAILVVKLKRDEIEKFIEEHQKSGREPEPEDNFFMRLLKSIGCCSKRN